MPKAQRPQSFRMLFDEVAQEYDRVRPGYPRALIEDVIALSSLPEQGSILEIGCGTGQATLPFAQRGYTLHCLDIGQNFVGLATRKFQSYPNVQIQHAAFEDWMQQGYLFDLVMSATAFHWIAPDIGYPKAAQVLKNTGSVAIFSNEHPMPHAGFFAEVQLIYQRVVPEWSERHTTSLLDEDIQATAAVIDATRLFEPVVVRTYPWEQSYTAERYLDVLNTYSNHRSLEPEKRTRLFDAIGDLIEKEYGGKVLKEYLAVLYIAKKR
jgi:SAM-dependent methyltransferase